MYVSKGKKIALFASSSFNDKNLLFEFLDNNDHRISTIIIGSTEKNNLDKWTLEWARLNGKPVLVCNPRWYDKDDTYFPSAAFDRSRFMISEADNSIFFYDGSSVGTKKHMEMADQMSKPKIVKTFIPVNENEKPDADIVPPKRKKKKEAADPALNEKAIKNEIDSLVESGGNSLTDTSDDVL